LTGNGIFRHGERRTVAINTFPLSGAQDDRFLAFFGGVGEPCGPLFENMVKMLENVSLFIS
jgi:hypothetical protein